MMKIKTDVNSIVGRCCYAGIGIGLRVPGQVPGLGTGFRVSVNDATIG